MKYGFIINKDENFGLEAKDAMKDLLKQIEDGQISYQEFNNKSNEVDRLLGGDTIYAEKNRKQFLTRSLSYQEAKGGFEKKVNESGLTNAYGRLFAESCIVGRFAKFEAVKHNEVNEKLKMQPLIWKFWTNSTVVRGALALITLNIGANISFGKVTGQIAGANVNIDHLAIYSSFADMVSSLFGGSPVESIISATADAPNAVLSGIIMMGIMAVILFAKLLPKIGHYVPRASIAGFLLVLGAIVTLPINAQLAFQNVALNSPMAAVLGIVIISTARFDPFIGMMSGVIIRALFQLAGVL